MIRYFNTSGPNIPAEHYTLFRRRLLDRGKQLVENCRYFTIWAPRQTGKSTYFRQLAADLKTEGYKVCHVNVENFLDSSLSSLMKYLNRKLSTNWETDLEEKGIQDLFNRIEKLSDGRLVWIIDEIEGLNPALFGQFLHSIRNLYHSRETHALKSVILVGVSNIIGAAQDNASPFNIADNLPVDFFTEAEVYELLQMHTTETGQRFNGQCQKQIAYITAGQPGLVNGFAQKLCEEYPNMLKIGMTEYNKIEDWYLRLAIDKNISNIINKGMQQRQLVESLLYGESKHEFRINNPAIKFLHVNGLIKEDENKQITFWVPLYKKCLYDAFYPFSNGEDKHFFTNGFQPDIEGVENGKINFAGLLEGYKDYIRRRGFRYFMEKDENGNYKSIKEAALIYSFETYIQSFLQELGGKSYLEPHAGLGRADLIVNVMGEEVVFESKVYRHARQYQQGLKQLAYYCKSIGVERGFYVVFITSTRRLAEGVIEGVFELDGVSLRIDFVRYDEKKDF